MGDIFSIFAIAAVTIDLFVTAGKNLEHRTLLIVSRSNVIIFSMLTAFFLIPDSWVGWLWLGVGVLSMVYLGVLIASNDNKW